MTHEEREHLRQFDRIFDLPDSRDQRIEEDRELEYLASRAGIRLDENDD